jgi:Kef-type K+ transport system membrane component KefB
VVSDAAEAQWAVAWLEQIGELEHLAAGIQTGTTIAIAASTDLFLALALAMAFFTPCSAILTQSYGNSIGQFWHTFA